MFVQRVVTFQCTAASHLNTKSTNSVYVVQFHLGLCLIIFCRFSCTYDDVYLLAHFGITKNCNTSTNRRLVALHYVYRLCSRSLWHRCSAERQCARHNVWEFRYWDIIVAANSDPPPPCLCSLSSATNFRSTGWPSKK